MSHTRSIITRHKQRNVGMTALALGALGVVFGDIGTSPLYSLQTVFSADGFAVKTTSVIGTTSCSADGSITVRPLTADITEIAGVIIPSPKKSATPKRPAPTNAGLTHGRLITAV